MKKISNKDYASALYELTKDLKGEKLRAAVTSFAKMLFRNGSAKRVDNIIAEFVRYSKKQEGVVGIEITSAKPLTTKAITEIKKFFGNKVEETQKIDKELLGGIKVRTDDLIFDGSIRKQLELLKQSIN